MPLSLNELKGDTLMTTWFSLLQVEAYQPNNYVYKA